MLMDANDSGKLPEVLKETLGTVMVSSLGVGFWYDANCGCGTIFWLGFSSKFGHVYTFCILFPSNVVYLQGGADLSPATPRMSAKKTGDAPAQTVLRRISIELGQPEIKQYLSTIQS